MLDWIRIGLLITGVLCVVTGLLPAAEAKQNLARVAPLILFLGSVIVLAKLARQAQVFDVIATRLAVLGRGNYLALFLLCVVFASVTTMFLNLDTTAVLLTPVLLALAARAGIAPLPLAMTTMWLANTASLLLPVSNLTNLLAADRVALDAPQFLARMWAPQLAAIAATMVCLWIWYWRRSARGADRYVPPPMLLLSGPAERALFGVTGGACLLFILAIPFIRNQIEIAATIAAALAVLAYLVWDRRALRWSLVPWQLLIFVAGLFLVVPTLSRLGLFEVMQALIGVDPGWAGSFRAATAGAVLSNVANNLPAYTAGEAAVPVANGTQLLALLIGTNVTPIVTPWASLATLLCLESCREHGLHVPPWRFVWTSLALAVLALLTAVAALLVTG
ncbi:arsenic transporter [Pseudonocardiaceae bacterium YIM PH 21723]|nr:arsenic transporter [Pseudonocardiaceae bacterium YIM PH 21723]